MARSLTIPSRQTAGIAGRMHLERVRDIAESLGQRTVRWRRGRLERHPAVGGERISRTCQREARQSFLTRSLQLCATIDKSTRKRSPQGINREFRGTQSEKSRWYSDNLASRYKWPFCLFRSSQ